MSILHILILLHSVLPLLVQFNSTFTTIHAFVTGGIGIYWALTAKSSHKALLTIFYITGAELLWRGFRAGVFWEYGKYSIILILLILVWRFGISRLKRKTGFLIVILLLPSFISLIEYNRQDISHAISGPICLGIAVAIFQNQIINHNKIKEYFIALLLPIISLFILMFISTIQHGAIDIKAAYLDEYTTAGIGPNQASNILGLGLFTSFLLFFLDNKNKKIYSIIGLGMLFQTIVTHSRGGFWNALFAIAIGTFFMMSERNDRIKFISSLIFVSGLLYFVIFPKLDDASGGSISNRYLDTNLSQREYIIESELTAFSENPVFGIGPGMSRSYRMDYFDSRKHTHTEYTRLLGEHGIFGIGIIIIFIYLTWTTFLSNKGFARSIAISLAAWSLLFMFHSATRLVAPSILFGLATSQFIFNKEKENFN